MGDRLSAKTYKIRFAIKSKGRGKSGGGRLITYINIAIENRLEKEQVNIYLISIYDKADLSSLPSSLINERIRGVIFEEE